MASSRKRRRGRRNRGRFGFLYKLLSFLLIFAAILTGCVVFFRVDNIIVEGEQRYTEEQIIQASGIQRGENLFRLNKFQIVNDVWSKLPYVDNLSISRKLPDTIILEVTERVPVAVIQVKEAYWLLDAKCRLLERGDASLTEGYARILGITPLGPAVGGALRVDEAEQQKLESLQALLSALRDNQMTGSVRDFIDLTTENKIRFSYGANLTIVMPLRAEFDKYVFRLKQSLLTMDADGVERLGTLDMTYADKTAHLFPERWLPEVSAPPPAEPPQSTAEPGGSGEPG